MGFLNMIGLVPIQQLLDVQTLYADQTRMFEAKALALNALRSANRAIADEYLDYRASAEDRFRAIAALETPSCARVGKNMARLARAGFEAQQ